MELMLHGTSSGGRLSAAVVAAPPEFLFTNNSQLVNFLPTVPGDGTVYLQTDFSLFNGQGTR